MIKQYKHLVHSTKHFENLNIQADFEYKHQHILSLEAFERANKEITTWDNYEPTPLHFFPIMAKHAGV
jgi:diaminopropionate ammonia-lyase